MHNKFFVVDDKYIWTGSANISDTGISLIKSAHNNGNASIVRKASKILDTFKNDSGIWESLKFWK
jgi:hypothetical protein